MRPVLPSRPPSWLQSWTTHNGILLLPWTYPPDSCRPLRCSLYIQMAGTIALTGIPNLPTQRHCIAYILREIRFDKREHDQCDGACLDTAIAGISAISPAHLIRVMNVQATMQGSLSVFVLRSDSSAFLAVETMTAQKTTLLVRSK